MGILLLIAFIAIPVVEIAVFIEVGSRIGGLNTIILVFLTALIGTWMLRSQGFQTLQRVQESLNRNIFPMAEVFDGLCLLVAGALLLTPGFFTDAIGFLLFIPPFRRLLRGWIWLWLSRSGKTRVWVDGEAAPREHGHRGRTTPPGTIEGDFREVDPEKDRNNDRKPPLGRP